MKKIRGGFKKNLSKTPRMDQLYYESFLILLFIVISIPSIKQVKDPQNGGICEKGAHRRNRSVQGQIALLSSS